MMSNHKGRGTLGWWRRVLSHFFDCAIHKRTNQCEVFGVLFIVDKAQTSFNMFMTKVGSSMSHTKGWGT